MTWWQEFFRREESWIRNRFYDENTVYLSARAFWGNPDLTLNALRAACRRVKGMTVRQWLESLRREGGASATPVRIEEKATGTEGRTGGGVEGNSRSQGKAAHPRPVGAPGLRIIVIPDTQAEPGLEYPHLYWAGQYIAEKSPDVVVHLGDLRDMPSLSCYESNTAKAWARRSVKEDVEAGNEALAMLEDGMLGWGGRKVLLRGNHEGDSGNCGGRISRWMRDNPGVAHDFYETLSLAEYEYGWEVHEFLRPVEIGGVLFCHYFPYTAQGRSATGRPSSSAVAALKGVGQSFVAGHRQGKQLAECETASGIRRAIIAGSFYQHNPSFLGPAETQNYWRGILMLNEVKDGNFDLTEVSLGFLKRKYG